MKITEENYISQLKKKNEQALRYFIEHDGWIVKSLISQKLSGDAQAQEECMNDVFLAIWENVERYDSKRAAFTTWVAAVTRYRLLNYMRAERQKILYEDIEDCHVIGERDIRLQFEQEEEMEFRQLLQNLSSVDQEIFMRLFWNEQDYEQISNDLGMPRSAIYNHVSRGKRQLRKQFKKECEQYE